MISREGRKQPGLRTLGPLLKGVLWETIAVRELRVQAEVLAGELVNPVNL